MRLRIDDNASVLGPGLNEILALPIGKDVDLHAVGFDALDVSSVGRVDTVAPNLLACLSGGAANQLDAGVGDVVAFGTALFVKIDRPECSIVRAVSSWCCNCRDWTWQGGTPWTSPGLTSWRSWSE